MLSNTAWMILFTTLLRYSILLFTPFFNPFIQTTDGEIPFGFISHVNDLRARPTCHTHNTHD